MESWSSSIWGLFKLSFLTVEIHCRLYKEGVKFEQMWLSTHKIWRFKNQDERRPFFVFVWLLTGSQQSRTNHSSKAMELICFMIVSHRLEFSLSHFCLKAFHSHNKLKIRCEIQKTTRCHTLDNESVSSEVQMSLGHIFRDCQHSDEPENSWENTHNRELPKSMSKWREKTLANIKVSLVAFLQIFLSFRTENWGAVFSQETTPGKRCCRACHIDKVRSTGVHNRLQQLTALALWEFTHTNKSSAAEESNNPVLSVLNHRTANISDF